jgi:hypothetical protein
MVKTLTFADGTPEKFSPRDIPWRFRPPTSEN